MNTKDIIKKLELATSIDDFIHPFVESGQSLASHVVDELKRIENLELALSLERQKNKDAFVSGVRSAYKELGYKFTKDSSLRGKLKSAEVLK